MGNVSERVSFCANCHVDNPAGRTTCRQCHEDLRVVATAPVEVPAMCKEKVQFCCHCGANLLEESKKKGRKSFFKGNSWQCPVCGKG